jgi:hypothetical protein
VNVSVRKIPFVVAALVALAVTAGASPSTGGPPNCRPGIRALAGVASGRTLATYDDFIEDAGAAPDFCASNFVTNDNEAMLMGMHIHNRSSFAANDLYAIFLDTDENVSTGGTFGSEFRLVFDGASRTLGRWNGSGFDSSTPQTSVKIDWLEGLGPVVSISRAELGNPEGLNFVLASIRDDDIDLAPDSGTWSYEVTPLELAVQSLKVGPARAGKSLVARMVVTRSDLESPLVEGAVACAAKVGGKTLRGKGAFADEAVVCMWRLPANARGKKLTGSVAAKLQGVQAKQAFTVKVK